MTEQIFIRFCTNNTRINNTYDCYSLEPYISLSYEIPEDKESISRENTILHAHSKHIFNNTLSNRAVNVLYRSFKPSISVRLKFVNSFVKPGYICGRTVQRTNYGSHYQLHSNVQAQLDGWIELRCPLSFLGCKYAVVNLRPNSEYNHLLYNPALATFTTRYESATNQRDIPIYSKSTNNGFFDFDQLPAELLIYLSFFLDDMSLLSLSKISKRLSTVYNNILCARLIVTPQWDKVHYTSSDLFSWRITGFLWSFPQRAESIKGWRSAHGASARAKISAHLTSCHYNDKTIRVFPFCYFE
ncbi:F-box only protein 30 [Schistosoma japonicum]|nr:F-box only protein 30 [Schistosoma japonicum]